MKLHARDNVVGISVICLEARRYSAVAFPVFWACLRKRKNKQENIDINIEIVILMKIYFWFQTNSILCSYLLFQAQNMPIIPEIERVTNRTTYSSQPNLAWRSDRDINFLSFSSVAEIRLCSILIQWSPILIVEWKLAERNVNTRRISYALLFNIVEIHHAFIICTLH